MKKKIILMAMNVAVIFGVAGCGVWQDVDFARSVMNSLIAGRYSARRHIDWERFVVLEKNVGAEYKLMPNDKEKSDYQRSFIDSFQQGFKSKGATQESFVHWRVFNDADPKVTYVAADNANGSAILIFYIVHDKGGKKLAGIRAIGLKDKAKYAEFEKEQRHVLQTGLFPAQK